MVKVGIIGLGTMGRQHMDAYRQMPDVAVAAVYDHHADRAAAFAQEYGVSVASDLNALLAACDIIDICTPTYRHAEYALPAIEAGKAVVCEKPLARTLEDCQRIVEAVKAHNTLFMPAHVLRFFPEYRTAHQLIRNSVIGAVAAVRMRRGGDFPRTKSDWNAVPNDPRIADLSRFGMVTPEQQARYVPLLFERARRAAGDRQSKRLNYSHSA